MSRRSWRASDRHGFTFVELLVSIVIAGIVFAAMVPLFVQAQKKNSADAMRIISTNVAQDKIEKVRQLGYGSITLAHLNSTSFASGQFGTTETVSTGQSTKDFQLTYGVTQYPTGSSGLTSEYKVVSVTVTWTGNPKPVKPATLTTIVYRQYAGPPILSFATDPVMDESGVLGDTSLSTVELSATIDTSAGVPAGKVVFSISAYGGATIETKTVTSSATTSDSDTTCEYDSSTATFVWRWDASAAENGLYDFQVTAYSAADSSPGNTPHLYPRIQHEIPPDPPTGVTVTGGDGAVSVVWHASGAEDADSYEVYRGAGTSGPWTLVGTVPSTTQTYADSTVTNGTTYYYAVRLVTTAGKYSDLVVSGAVTPQKAADTTPPTAPGSVTATAVTGAATIELTWTAATDTGEGVAQYEIWRSADGVDWGSAPLVTWTNLTLLSYDDSSAGWSSTWYYKIRALDGALNAGPFSSPSVHATTQAHPQHALTVQNTVNGNNKTRYVWIQNANTGLYYTQAGASSASAPAGVGVPSKNGTKVFSNLPDDPYHVWVATTNSFASASIQKDVLLSGSDTTVTVN